MTIAATIRELERINVSMEYSGCWLNGEAVKVMAALPSLLAYIRALEAVAVAGKETLNGVSCLCAEGVEFLGRVALADAVLKDLKPLQASLDNLKTLEAEHG